MADHIASAAEGRWAAFDMAYKRLLDALASCDEVVADTGWGPDPAQVRQIARKVLKTEPPDDLVDQLCHRYAPFMRRI